MAMNWPMALRRIEPQILTAPPMYGSSGEPGIYSSPQIGGNLPPVQFAVASTAPLLALIAGGALMARSGGLDRAPPLQLSPEEQRIVDYHRNTIKSGKIGLYEKGRPVTVYAVGPKIRQGRFKGKFASVPGWVGGRRLSEDEAYDYWKDEIEAGKWPVYESGDALNARAKAIHSIMDQESSGPFRGVAGEIRQAEDVMPDDFGFGKAFSTARRMKLKEFTWRGRRFTTRLAKEVKSDVR